MLTVGHVTHIKPYKKGEAHLAELFTTIKSESNENERTRMKSRRKKGPSMFQWEPNFNSKFIHI